MNKDSKKILNLFSRYLAVLILGTSNLYLIYKILTPLTIHTANLSIKIFTPTVLVENIIQFNQTIIEIAPSCMAGSAFYLLLALILSTANIQPKTRFKAVLTALTVLFVLNIIRILILASLTATPNFETIHFIFWHIVSTAFVVTIYIATIKYYKIKSVPILSDLKYLKGLTKTKHKKKKK